MENKLTLNQIKALLKYNKSVRIHSDMIEHGNSGMDIVNFGKEFPFVIHYNNEGNIYKFYANTDVYNEENKLI